MRLVKTLAVISAVVVGLLGIGLFVYVSSIGCKGLPDYNALVELSGMKGEVKVYRDSFGVPHIYAENEGDLYRAVGYSMAQDRLWQMDLIRRACTGRLSEIFGEGLVETDLLMRALRMPEKTRMVSEVMDDEVLEAVEAFSDGVNQYIEAHKGSLPPEFIILGYEPEPWTAEDSGNLVGYMTWDLTLGWDTEVVLDKIRRKLGEDMADEMVPDVRYQKTLVYPEFRTRLAKLDLDSTLLKGNRALKDLGLEVFSGSNNWAVSGEKSVTGKPILANDMHLGLDAPGIWYQMHQVVEGKLNVTGVALPGAPMIVAGHNENIAWGFTNVMVDNADFYLEWINPKNPNQYKFKGRWRDMEVRKETIKVKGGEAVEEELRFTHRGPVISRFKDVDDMAISMRWVGNEYSDEAGTLYQLNRARNWKDFRKAMRTFISTSQNAVYADVEGNIGLQCSAGVPKRKGADSLFILPGWTDKYDWKGMVPFHKLPYSFNPKSGHVSSANNKTAGNRYPYYISRWFCLHYRIDRIREMLEEKDKLSIEDIKVMHADQNSILARDIKDIIVSEVEKAGDLTVIEKQSLDMLAGWDGDMAKTSQAASIFEKFIMAFVKNMFSDEMGDDLYREFLSSSMLSRYAIDKIFKKKDSAWCDNVDTAGFKETFTDIVQKSFKDSVAGLGAELGSNPDAWQWGKIHRLTLEHPLGRVKMLDRILLFNRGPYEVGGSFHTVCPYSYSFRNPFKATAGASQRHIYNLADWDSSLSVIPTGTSGIPASDHYCDQTHLYIGNEYHSDYISRDLIEKNAKYEMRIKGKE